MDIPTLQQRLRRFADERDWQPFQTPKNLAMAMTVEAAELLEIFQWLTPEQSQNLSDDQRRHLGEELSDVLLYLVQIADHTGAVVSSGRTVMFAGVFVGSLTSVESIARDRIV